MRLLLFVFTFLFTFFIAPSTVLAIDLEQVVAQSQAGDKTLEITGDQFYAYPGNSQIGEPPAPSGWKVGNFNDSSWTQSRDAYEVESDRANQWWCIEFPNNCRPLGMTQITGPSGFVDRETLLVRKSYTINPPSGYRIKNVILDIWSDNNSWAYIDGQFITNAGLDNTQSVTTNPNQTVTYSISALSIGTSSTTSSITNTIAVQVSNDTQGEGNPIGIAYRVKAIYEPINNASCGTTNIPTTVSPSQTFTASIQVNNAGGTTWSPDLNYRLASRVNQDNTVWGFNRVNLTSASPSTVSPNQQTTFTFNPQAPSLPGDYNFYWGMVRDGYEHFGSTCGARITVTSPPTPTPTPPPATSPTIQSLYIREALSNTQKDGLRVSGANTTQGGTGFNNPLVVTLNATAGSATTASYYMAFYAKSGGLISNSSQFLSTVQSRLNDLKNGILLRYDSNGKYYVWANSKWADITTLTTPGYPVCTNDNCINNPLIYRVFPGSSAKQWRLFFDKNFGDKSMYTAAYVSDSNNLSAYTGGDITPQ